MLLGPALDCAATPHATTTRALQRVDIDLLLRNDPGAGRRPIPSRSQVTNALGPCRVVGLRLDSSAELWSSCAYSGPKPIPKVEILLGLMQSAEAVVVDPV